MRTHPRLSLAATVLLGTGMLSVISQAPAQAARHKTTVIEAERGESPPLTSLPPAHDDDAVEVPERGAIPADDGWHGTTDGVQDADAPTIAAIPAPVSFEGLTGTAKPPDPVGDVGPNHYVEMVNTRVGVYTKAGANLLNVTIGSIFTGLPGTHNCESNYGDPVVIHDQLAA